MKITYPLIVLAALAFAVCSCSKSSTPPTSTQDSTLNSYDQNFVMNASSANQDQMTLGRLAQTKSADTVVIAFADTLVISDSAAVLALQNVADTFRVTLSQSADSATQILAAGLDTLSGMAFDTVYLDDEITSQQNTIAMFQAELDSGSDVGIKAYAATWLPVMQMHLNTCDSLRRGL